MDPLIIAAQLTALLFALTLHEFAHAWVGHSLGDRTAADQGRLSLNPLAHIDPFLTLALPLLLIIAGSPFVFAAAKPVPFNPWALRGGKWGAALVAVAGPLTNLALAGFFAIWYQLVPLSNISAMFFQMAIIINISLFVFNMIPFPPLDGSRLLYAVAPEGLRDVMDRIERAGFVFLLLIMFVGYRFISGYVASITTFIINVLVPRGF